MNIDKFKANFTDGGMRPSLFEVQIGFPAGTAGQAAQQISVLCKGATIPESTVNNIDVAYQGRFIKLAGNRVFNDITLTFYASNDGAVRTAFEKWMSLMNTHEGNLGVVNPNLYKGDVIITPLSRDGKRLITYKCVGFTPNNISAIDLSFDAVDSIAEFAVTGGIDYFQTEFVK